MPKLILSPQNVLVPLTVPQSMHNDFCKNYLKATQNSGRLFMFAGDQKVEHLNKDFYGDGIDQSNALPQHFFEIASKSTIGVFATQLGLIARYAHQYKNIPYVVKLNSKTDLVSTNHSDPISRTWSTVNHVVQFKKQSGLDIVGIGMTIYLGSTYESEMLAQAASAIYQAHQHGLLTVVWAYPRGQSVHDERSTNIIAGAAGVATCLGADFVKVNAPHAQDNFQSAQYLQQAVSAAGNTKVICSGGSSQDEKNFLQDLYHQIHTGGAMGAAIGRNIHQKSVNRAIKFCNAVAAIIIDDVEVNDALALLM